MLPELGRKGGLPRHRRRDRLRPQASRGRRRLGRVEPRELCEGARAGSVEEQRERVRRAVRVHRAEKQQALERRDLVRRGRERGRLGVRPGAPRPPLVLVLG